ncbi:MAG TPA: phosphotransferase [Mobilitalea sp.]|nr:phosphotransferase [Mobilitalea sp.]
MLGNLIGKGNTAEVYEWGQDQVIKLFKEDYPTDAVEKEFRNALAVAKFNFDKPSVYARAEWEGRSGIIYEKLQGMTLLEWVMTTGETEVCGEILADVHNKILSNKVDGVKAHKDILRYSINQAHELEESLRKKILVTLDKLPDGDNLCHGDFHPGNIILYQDRRIIIDWMNVCSGHPYSDIARTIYLIEMTPIPRGIEDVEGFLRFRSKVVDAYLRNMGVTRRDIEQWLPVIVAGRLGDGCGATEVNAIIRFLNK